MIALLLPRAVYQAIRTHAEQAWPQECCGVLLGRTEALPPGGPATFLVEEAVPALNVRTASPATQYEIAPAELIRIERNARGRGLSIAGFYHSHPDQPAHWSPTDLAEAHWLGCTYLITSVIAGQAAETNAFFLAGDREENKRFENRAIRLVDPERYNSDH